MLAPKWVDKNLDQEKYRERYLFLNINFTLNPRFLILTDFSRCFEVHQKKLVGMHKKDDVKKLAKDVEDELEKKKNDKLKNHEFNLQGKHIMKVTGC